MRSRRRRALRLSILSVAIGALAATTTLPSASADAGQQPTQVTTKVEAQRAGPRIKGLFLVDGEPGHLIRVGKQMWVAISGNSGGNDLARVKPNGDITYVDVPGVSNLGSLVVGPDRAVWATLSTGVVRIPRANPANATAFAIGGFVDAQGIVTGPDKRLWAASGDTLFRFKPSDPVAAKAFQVAGMAARQVAASKTRIWVVDFGQGKIHIFKKDGTFVSRNVGGNPQGVVAGRGDQVLYSNPENNANHAARLQPKGKPRKTKLLNTDPSFQVAFGRDGNYWVGLFLTRQMARITPRGRLRKFGKFPAPYLPRNVAAGPNGTVWASLQNPGNNGALSRVIGVR